MTKGDIIEFGDLLNWSSFGGHQVEILFTFDGVIHPLTKIILKNCLPFKKSLHQSSCCVIIEIDSIHKRYNVAMPHNVYPDLHLVG